MRKAELEIFVMYNEDQASKMYNFMNVQFKLNDIYTDYVPEISSIQVRVGVYHPDFPEGHLSTFDFFINQPPAISEIQLEYDNTLSCNYQFYFHTVAEDVDEPLEYEYRYYSS